VKDALRVCDGAASSYPFLVAVYGVPHVDHESDPIGVVSAGEGDVARNGSLGSEIEGECGQVGADIYGVAHLQTSGVIAGPANLNLTDAFRKIELKTAVAIGQSCVDVSVDQDTRDWLMREGVQDNSADGVELRRLLGRGEHRDAWKTQDCRYQQSPAAFGQRVQEDEPLPSVSAPSSGFHTFRGFMLRISGFERGLSVGRIDLYIRNRLRGGDSGRFDFNADRKALAGSQGFSE
jgi:hypothetical protein